MTNKYCIPGLAYSCPHSKRCEEEGKHAVIIATNFTRYNRIKHSTWIDSSGNLKTCILRAIIHKSLHSLDEELKFEFAEEEAKIYLRK